MNFENLSVLVIDDNANMRRLIVTILHSIGVARLAEAACAGDALELMRKGSSYDLILVDYLMEGQNGIEFVRTVRREFSKAELPIIIITGYAELVRLEEAKGAGANDFIAKPFTTKTLIQRISRVLAASALSRRMGEIA